MAVLVCTNAPGATRTFAAHLATIGVKFPSAPTWATSPHRAAHQHHPQPAGPAANSPTWNYGAAAAPASRASATVQGNGLRNLPFHDSGAEPDLFTDDPCLAGSSSRSPLHHMWHAVSDALGAARCCNRESKGAAHLKILGDLMTNLLAATIGFTAGWLRLTIRRLVRLRRARRFWKPFMDGELRLVLAVFNEPDHIEWERSGVAGVGDVVALTEIEQHLRSTRLADYEISYAHQLRGEHLRSNLVLIGGADSNRVTREVMDRLPLTFVFNNPARIRTM